MLVPIAMAAGCAADGSAMDLSGEALKSHGTSWSYSGETGPTHWEDLDAAWTQCSDGTRQSPIDIPSSIIPKPFGALEFFYKKAPIDLVNNGHTIQFDYEAGSFILREGVRYDLVQFHFHAHSEHRVGGDFAPLEAHLVHRAADGTLSVVGVLIEEGDNGSLPEALFADWPTHSGERHKLAEATFDASSFLPDDVKGYRYDGSLTTPPCSEGVHWYVLAEPLVATPVQIAAFTALYPNNSRPLQPLAGRTIN